MDTPIHICFMIGLDTSKPYHFTSKKLIDGEGKQIQYRARPSHKEKKKKGTQGGSGNKGKPHKQAPKSQKTGECGNFVSRLLMSIIVFEGTPLPQVITPREIMQSEPMQRASEHLMDSTHPIPSHPLPSHLIFSHPIPSHPTPSHPSPH